MLLLLCYFHMLIIQELFCLAHELVYICEEGMLPNMELKQMAKQEVSKIYIYIKIYKTTSRNILIILMQYLKKKIMKKK